MCQQPYSRAVIQQHPDNDLSDISALEGFTPPDELNIGENNIADLSVLDGISIDKFTV